MSAVAEGWARLRGARPLRLPVVRWSLGVIAALLAVGTAAVVALSGPGLPKDAQGTLVYISDRSGADSLYVRKLPKGRDRQLTYLGEPVRDPALSPDGTQVAFSVGGRIGLVPTAGGPVRILTLATEWKDATPMWWPDGRSLAVSAQSSSTSPRDIHQLSLEGGDELTRRPLTDTPFLDETQPVISPDGRWVVFVREDSLYRVDLRDKRPPSRVTGGFRKARAPRFMPSGRVLFLWSEGKEYGIDTIDLDGKSRETLHKGSAFYRTIVSSPDGRFLAATFTFDLGFHAWEVLKLRQHEELQLLDLRGARVAELAGSWRYANHTADWGR